MVRRVSSGSRLPLGPAFQVKSWHGKGKVLTHSLMVIGIKKGSAIGI
jgi:hypothetical protein